MKKYEPPSYTKILRGFEKNLKQSESDQAPLNA